MNFCEECGAKLTPNTRFCEECGSPITQYENTVETFKDFNVYDYLTVFQSSSWTSDFVSMIDDCDDEIGLIFTNIQLLSNELSVSEDEILDLISDFISDRKNHGVSYFLLDVSNNAINTKIKDVDSHISLLKKVVHKKCPLYLFILGSDKIIPVEYYDDKTGYDNNISSDLPYAILENSSPWKNKKYDFKNSMRVGRLPTFKNESFNDFKTYFENIKSCTINTKQIIEAGLAAKQWVNTSNIWFDKIANKKVLTSPQLDKFSAIQNIGTEKNLLYFNLHGAEDSDACDWYGQENENYPSAFSPSNILKQESLYILGVEACYGARYINYKKDESILLTAITSKCLGFLGSSKIAYGACYGEGSCADVIIGTYLKSVRNGLSIGESFAVARSELTSKRKLDAEEIKTLLEFSLYGDPSFRFGENTNQKSFVAQKSISKLHIPMPDVLGAVNLEIAKVSEKIESIVNNNIYSNYPEFNGIKPNIYKDTSDGTYSAVYKKDNEKFVQMVNAYFNENGQILREYISK